MVTIDARQAQTESLVSGFSDEDVSIFVGDNAPYYLQKWRVLKLTASNTSWHWPGALLTGFWLLYRKMYLYFFLYYIVNLALSWIPIVNFIWWIASIAVGGLFANTFYFDYTRKKMSEIALMAPDSQNRRSVLALKGGASWVGPIILIVVNAIIIAIIALTIGIAASNQRYYY